MYSNPILRCLIVFRNHWGYTLIGGVLGIVFSYLVALVTPYLYQSESVLAINSGEGDSFIGLKRKMFGARRQTGARLKKALLLLNSNHVIADLIKDIDKYVEDVDIPLAFPKDFSITDIRQRIRLVSERLGKGTVTAKHIQRRKLKRPTKDLLLQMFRRHLAINPDWDASTISISYTAATPEIAHKLVSHIVSRFLLLLEQTTKRQLRKREEFLLKRIETELTRVRKLEDEMRSLYERHPEMASLDSTRSRRRRGRDPGLSVFAREYLRHKVRLEEIDIQINTNRQVLKDIDLALTSGAAVPQAIKKSLRKQVIDEIGRLELRKLDLTVIRNLPDSSDQLRYLDQKIAKLRKVLSRIGEKDRALMSTNLKSALSGKGIEELRSEGEAIAGKNSRLVFEREFVKRDYVRAQAKMKKGVTIEFHLNDLLRQGNEASDLIKLLAANLQKIRLDLSSEGRLASVLIPPSTPYFSTNLSARRKMFFGFFAGILLTAMILILRDMYQPALQTLDELDELNVKHLGIFSFSAQSINRMASHVMTFSQRRTPQGPGQKSARVTVFSSMSVDFNFGIWVEEIASLISTHGFKVAVLKIGLEPKIRSVGSDHEERIEKVWLHPNEIAFSFDRMMKGLREKHDWVFVIGPHLYQIPGETLVTASADQVFHVVKLSVTKIREIRKIKDSAMTNFDSHHFCVPFKGRTVPYRGRRPHPLRRPAAA